MARRFVRVGHAGAGAHAQHNSLRSFQIALDYGVDMIEFDVRALSDGTLVLWHDPAVPTDGGPVALASLTAETIRPLRPEGEPIATLDQGLELLRKRVLLGPDLKAQGYELAVLDRLDAHGVASDSLFSTLYAGSIRRLYDARPALRLGISYPEDKANASKKPWMAPAVSAGLWFMRWTLMMTVGRLLAQSQANHVMLYHKLLSAGAVQRIQSAGVRVFAWTVDDLDRLRRMAKIGVDGLTTNRPELFGEMGRPGE
jgi:glycerophosphoryl diester phosphodiesterase